MKTNPDYLQKILNATSYSFVVTILWFGFVVAISGLETPLRTTAETIELSESLTIGRLVFHTLNKVELALAALLVAAILVNQSMRVKGLVIGTLIPVALLGFQTWLLYTVLDTRTDAILRGETVAGAPYHVLYIALELCKVVALSWLVVQQLRHFKAWLTDRSGELEP